MFFEPPPEPHETSSRPYRPPPWVSRPRGVLLSGVPLALVLASTEEVAVALGRLGACEDGFEAELSILTRGDVGNLDDDVFSPLGPRSRRRGADPGQELRFGVQYADGRKAQMDAPRPAPDGERPIGPVICSGGGGGGGGEWHQDLWLWPLPPPGPFSFALEWKQRGIGLTMRELDATPIREAARKSQRVFPNEDMPDTPGFTSHSM